MSMAQAVTCASAGMVSGPGSRHPFQRPPGPPTLGSVRERPATALPSGHVAGFEGGASLAFHQFDPDAQEVLAKGREIPRRQRQAGQAEQVATHLEHRGQHSPLSTENDRGCVEAVFSRAYHRPGVTVGRF